MPVSADSITKDEGSIPQPPRATTVIYLLALMVIAAISISSHFVTNSIVARQQGTAMLVNTAGRQRMLSQRIARIAEEMADGTADRAAGAASLNTLATQMETAQQLLLHGDARRGMPMMNTPALRSIYYGSTHLQQQVDEFVQHTRAFAASPSPSPKDPDLRAIATASDQRLLQGLDSAVSAYQAASEHDIRHLRHVMNSLTGLMLVVLLLEALLIYRPLFNRLTGAIALLVRASTTDFLTDVMNRGAFLNAAERELAQARRSGQPMCLLMADIDRFKSVNDRFGHGVGDLVLKHFAAIAQQNLRAGDLLGRLGGEEFALLLPATDMPGGSLAAERIRERFAGTTAAVTPRAERVSATVSFGVVCGQGEPLTELLAAADALLYRAKHNGRNRVEPAPRIGSIAVPQTRAEDARP